MIFMANRITPHIVETRSYDNVRSKIHENGEALFREFTGRDYGVDAVVELFDNGNVTGKLALLQIKSTQFAIVPLKKSEEISCEISSSNAKYALQNNIPVILIYASLQEKGDFYFANVQSILNEEHIRKIDNGKKTIRVRIPLINSTQESIQPFFDIINSFYEQK